MSRRNRRKPWVGPQLRYPVHAFAGPGPSCSECPLPRENRVHDLTRLPQTTAEQRAAEARRFGEHEEE